MSCGVGGLETAIAVSTSRLHSTEDVGSPFQDLWDYARDSVKLLVINPSDEVNQVRFSYFWS